jgi:hypothetical protein
MSSSPTDNTIHIDLDMEKLDQLLEKQENHFTRQDTMVLKPLLEIEFERALQKENTNLVIKISHMLIGLNGYISSFSDSIVDFVKYPPVVS